MMLLMMMLTTATAWADTETVSIENLHVCGDIYASGKYAAGIIADEDQSILFLSAGNTLYYPSGLNGGVTITPFRAYFKIGEDETMARQLTAFNLSFGDSSESTGIVEITNPAPSPIPEQSSPTRSLSPTGVGRAAWYTLDGRRLDGKPTKRGLYVHGGRKVVVH